MKIKTYADKNMNGRSTFWRKSASPDAFQAGPLPHRRQVRHILRGPALQPKLMIGAPNDVFEQEADRVADQVMRMPYPAVQHHMDPEEEENLIQTKPLADQASPLLQRQAELAEEEELLQTVSNNTTATAVSPDIESKVNSLKGGGQPLSDNERNFFEPRFGYDFSGVRVHTYAESDKLSRQLEAKAFSTGKDIFFLDGAYQPDTDAGKGLMAHELTHVMQQQNAPGSGIGPKRIIPLAPATETETKRVVAAVALRKDVSPQPIERAELGLARQAAGEEKEIDSSMCAYQLVLPPRDLRENGILHGSEVIIGVDTADLFETIYKAMSEEERRPPETKESRFLFWTTTREVRQPPYFWYTGEIPSQDWVGWQRLHDVTSPDYWRSRLPGAMHGTGFTEILGQLWESDVRVTFAARILDFQCVREGVALIGGSATAGTSRGSRTTEERGRREEGSLQVKVGSKGAEVSAGRTSERSHHYTQETETTRQETTTAEVRGRPSVLFNITVKWTLNISWGRREHTVTAEGNGQIKIPKDRCEFN